MKAVNKHEATKAILSPFTLLIILLFACNLWRALCGILPNTVMTKAAALNLGPRLWISENIQAVFTESDVGDKRWVTEFDANSRRLLVRRKV